MVQEFHVVRCFSCESFQVQQEFGRGSGADCRRHVQKLNAMRGAKLAEHEHNTWGLSTSCCSHGAVDGVHRKQEEADGEDIPEEQRDKLSQTQVSNWSKYLDAPKESEEEPILIDRQQPSANNRKRKRSNDSISEQSKWSNLKKPASSRQDSTIAPRLHTASETTGPVSRWTQFLGSSCQEEEEVETPSTSRWSQSTYWSSSELEKLSGHHHMLPVSSMFDSGEDFEFGPVI